MQDNGTRVRSGSTSIFNQTIGGDSFGCNIHPIDGRLVLGSLYNTRIQKSVDGGLTFASACAGISECGTGAAPFFTKIVPWEGDLTGNTVYTYVNTRVYQSKNYAQTWSPLSTVQRGCPWDRGERRTCVSLEQWWRLLETDGSSPE